MRDRHIIYGIHVANRTDKAGAIQELLTRFGGNIKTRIGLHDVGSHVSAPSGVILLEMFGNEVQFRDLKSHLILLEGVEVKEMVFDHEA